MRIKRSVIGLVVLLLAAHAARADELRNVKVGQEVPPYTLRTLAGKELSSADLLGRVVVIVYLSAEQRSSEAALRDADAVARELRDPDLAIVSMTADATRIDFFRALRDRLNIHHPVGLDVGRRMYGGLGLVVLPTTVIVDRTGRLAHVISSHKSDHEHVLRSRVLHALGRIDDDELADRLTSRTFERDRPADRIARHRAAARLLREGGLLADAARELDAALEIDPNDLDAQLDLASLRIAENRFDDAETIVERVTDVEPNHRRARLMTGILCYHSGDLDDAERALREALLLNRDPILTHYYLGLIAERRGDQSAAIEHFKESLGRLLEDRAF